jgi:hypothetical protein
MVHGIHIHIRNRDKKPLAIALSDWWGGRGGETIAGNVNNVQYMSNWNCHYKLSLLFV